MRRVAESELAANSRRCGLANTRENIIEVQCVSITFLLAFERGGNTLKCWQVTGWKVEVHPHPKKLESRNWKVESGKQKTGTDVALPAHFAQKIEAKGGSEGFGEEQQISSDDKSGARWTGRLCGDMVSAANKKVIVETKD
jgi:hypothetical protein